MGRTGFLHSSYQKEDAKHPRMHEFMKHEFKEILPVLYQILEIISISEFHNDSFIGEWPLSTYIAAPEEFMPVLVAHTIALKQNCKIVNHRQIWQYCPGQRGDNICGKFWHRLSLVTEYAVNIETNCRQKLENCNAFLNT